MFDSDGAGADGRAAAALDAVRVRAWVRALAEPSAAAIDAPLDDAGRVELLRGLEELKCAAEAVQAVVAVGLDASVRAEENRRGLPGHRQGRGVAGQVALARRESPHRGLRHLGLAKALHSELPCTMAAFRAGRVTEWRATLLARETACLSREHRAEVDAALAGDPHRLEAMGERELIAAAQRLGYRLDPESAVARRRRAEADRRVSLRPAPDVMTQLSALLPVKDGVAVFALLTREADGQIAAGDGRGRGQIMADTLVERVLGRATPTRYPTQTADGTGADGTAARSGAGALGPRPGAGTAAGSASSGSDPGPAAGTHGCSGTTSRPADPAPVRTATTSGAPDRAPDAAGDRAPDPASSTARLSRPAAGAAGCGSGVPGTPAPKSPESPTSTAAEAHGTTGGAHRGAEPRSPSPGTGDISTTIHLVVSDAVLLGGQPGSAELYGYGPIPADLARELVDEHTWLRRLYVAPRTGELVAADARTRRFPTRLAQLIRLRDQRCRTPWCDAPIRHTDHPWAVADGGPTSLGNGQGLCEQCNYTKEAPDWTARPRPGPRHTVDTTTPTGHRYRSLAHSLAEQVLPGECTCRGAVVQYVLAS